MRGGPQPESSWDASGAGARRGEGFVGAASYRYRSLPSWGPVPNDAEGAEAVRV